MPESDCSGAVTTGGSDAWSSTSPTCSSASPTRFPTRAAVVCGADALHLRASSTTRATRLAHVLRERGVGAGDHVGCYLRNSVAHLEAMLACYKLRAVPDQRQLPLRRRRARVPLRRRRPRRASFARRRHRASDVAAVARRRCAIDVGAGSTRTSGSCTSDPPRATSAHARATTTTCSTPAARPACRRAWCGARRTSSSARSAAGTPAARRSPRPSRSRRRCVDNPAQRLRAVPPAGRPRRRRSSSRSRSARSMHASGQWSALGTLLGGGKVVLYDRRATSTWRACSTSSNASASNAMNLVGDASARPLLDALEAEPGAWDTSSLRAARFGRQHPLGRREGRGCMAALPSRARRSSKASARRSRPRRRSP